MYIYIVYYYYFHIFLSNQFKKLMIIKLLEIQVLQWENLIIFLKLIDH